MGTDDVEASKSDEPEPIGQMGQSGGVNFSGGAHPVQGDVAGRANVGNTITRGISDETFRQLFVPLLPSRRQAPPEKREQAGPVTKFVLDTFGGK